MNKTDYTVRYVTPQDREDVLALVVALRSYGATNISADTQMTVAVWPTEEHEQQFDTACEEAQA